MSGMRTDHRHPDRGVNNVTKTTAVVPKLVVKYLQKHTRYTIIYYI